MIWEEGITHYCYCLKYWHSADPEEVWEFVQRVGGYISVQSGGEYYFWVPREHNLLFVIAWPELVRARNRDYV